MANPSTESNDGSSDGEGTAEDGQATDTAGSTAVEAAAAGGTDEPVGETTSGGGPGFEVSGALAGLAGLAGLLRRDSGDGGD